MNCGGFHRILLGGDGRGRFVEFESYVIVEDAVADLTRRQDDFQDIRAGFKQRGLECQFTLIPHSLAAVTRDGAVGRRERYLAGRLIVDGDVELARLRAAEGDTER